MAEAHPQAATTAVHPLQAAGRHTVPAAAADTAEAEAPEDTAAEAAVAADTAEAVRPEEEEDKDQPIKEQRL